MVPSSTMLGNLVFVDCEARGPCPALGRLTEFGAVKFRTWEQGTFDTFHGRIWESTPDPANPAQAVSGALASDPAQVFRDFTVWLSDIAVPVFVSDNPAFDWQWINDGFWVHTGVNPFGHSARRISDFYAGLVGDFRKTQAWKRLRVTRHDHNPVHDALGNVEAFARLLKGER